MSREEIEKQLRDKAHKILARMEHFKDVLHNSRFFLGGSAVAASNPNDIDIFFQSQEYINAAIRWIDSRISVVTEDIPVDSEFRKIYSGENAYTFKCPTSDVPFQFIRMPFYSLEIMIDSFDFSHIQAGIEVAEVMGKFEIVQVYWTDAYEKSLEIGDSWYMGSDNPFSALYRLGKYHAKGEVSALSLKTQTIKIVNDIFEQEYIGSAQIRKQLSVIGMSDIFEEENINLYLHSEDINRLIGNLTVLAWHKLFK